MFDFSFFLNCLSGRSLMLSLIAFQIFIKNSIVCSCFGQSISHSSGKPCVVIIIMGFIEVKKTLKLVGRSWFLNLYIKTAM